MKSNPLMLRPRVYQCTTYPSPCTAFFSCVRNVVIRVTPGIRRDTGPTRGRAAYYYCYYYYYRRHHHHYHHCRHRHHRHHHRRRRVCAQCLALRCGGRRYGYDEGHERGVKNYVGINVSREEKNSVAAWIFNVLKSVVYSFQNSDVAEYFISFYPTNRRCILYVKCVALKFHKELDY